MTESTVALALPLSTLNEDELRLVNEMLNRLAVYETSNRLKEQYYEGEQRVRHLGIAIPPHLQNIDCVVGWAGMSVDILAERIDWQGWRTTDGDDFGLGEVYAQNELAIEAGLAIKDSLIYGTSFLVVGTGGPGEANPLITVESARHMTGIWDHRTRRLSSALGINGQSSGGEVDDVTLYLPNSNIRLAKVSGVWVVSDRDDHNVGRVLVAQMVNDPRANLMGGRSQITKAIRAYVDQGVRTMLGMELNREFYSTPHRYVQGMEAEAFQDENGQPIPAWEAVMSKFMVAPPNENGQNPTFGQFTPASPAPYLDQIKGLAQMVAAEAAIPVTNLGFHTDNPPSGDAARIMESRLIKRAEDRQDYFGRALSETGRLALLVRDGEVPAEYTRISNKWRDPATPTRSAAADEVTKLVAAGILAPDSDIVLDRIGLDPNEKAQVANERRKANASQRIADIQAAVQGTEPEVA